MPENDGRYIILGADIDDDFYIHNKILLVKAGLSAARIKEIVGSFVDSE